MNAASAFPAEAGSAPTGAPTPSRRMVDAPMRAFHWLFALSFLGAYLTADGERWRLVHVTLGYTLIGLLAFRILWGLFGPRQARLSQWLARLRNAPAVLRGLWTEKPNLSALRPLLAALAVVSLLVLAGLTTASGYVLYDGSLGGMLEDAVEEVHEAMGNAMLSVVLLHVALVVGVGVFKGQHQLRAMVSGRVPGRGPDLVKDNRAWLAVLMLAAVLAFWAWQWQGAPQRADGAFGGSQHSSTQRHGNRYGDDDD